MLILFTCLTWLICGCGSFVWALVMTNEWVYLQAVHWAVITLLLLPSSHANWMHTMPGLTQIPQEALQQYSPTGHVREPQTKATVSNYWSKSRVGSGLFRYMYRGTETNPIYTPPPNGGVSATGLLTSVVSSWCTGKWSFGLRWWMSSSPSCLWS